MWGRLGPGQGALLALLLALSACWPGVRAVLSGDCYQFGSGGWDLIWWGEQPRIPSEGFIPICATGFGGVTFHWRQPQGVFLIPSADCPTDFSAPANDTFGELAPVSDSNTLGFVWIPPQVPGATFWVTSQVPGACQAGVKARVVMVGPANGAAEALAWRRRHWRHLALSLLLGLAAWAAAAAPD